MLTAGQQTAAQIFLLWGLAEEELPLCDFSRWSQGGSKLFATPTVQAAADIAFSPRGRKSLQNCPSPTVSMSNGAQCSGLCSSQDDGAILSSLRWSNLLPGPSCKTLTALAMCTVTSTSHSVLTITFTDEKPKAQTSWEIYLGLHSQEAVELGSKLRSG